MAAAKSNKSPTKAVRPNGSDNDDDVAKAAEDADQTQVQHYHTIDIRFFLALIVVTMAASFMAGVTLLPPVKVTRTTSMHDDGVMRDAFLLGDAVNSQQAAEQAREADQHRPAGQHLLVDIKGVDSEFLNSEELLSRAMVDTVLGSGLTLLSYHCHALVPSGVSCVGILLESHSKSYIICIVLLSMFVYIILGSYFLTFLNLLI